MHFSPSRHYVLLPLAIVCALFAVRCDTTVDAFVDRPGYKYSMYGILDVNRDTQWIRVENLQDGVGIGAPDTLDVTVRLTDETAGTSTVLRDSIFRDVSALNAQYHNFWTTAPIHAEHTYRLDVERDGRVETTATTTTPDSVFTYDTRGGRGSEFYLIVTSETPLAGAKAIFTGIPNNKPGCGGLTPIEVRIDLYSSTEAVSGDTYRIERIVPSAKVLQGYDCYDFGFENFKIRTADGGPDWPGFEEYHQLPLEATIQPDSFSNVDGGHGYVAGVYRRTYVIKDGNVKDIY
ncbi:hypothetical protein CRI94_00610 [Longibacter salinarum]|uniref:DUF4249 domain-containing protein n=1 Tax=Longibacter salinarum TaxID=1850348 RepID=A0A2A8D1J2_9BACT|nr:hypothetical protein [Longibacter salinarum]PEN14832.1 hypothetical protein CRI94_00610 [Longibacter salinarum]